MGVLVNTDEWEYLGNRAAQLVVRVSEAAGRDRPSTLEWFDPSEDDGAAVYDIDHSADAIRFNRVVAQEWSETLPDPQVAVRFEGVVLRAASDYLYGPPEAGWRRVATRHLRAETETLGDTYASAFHAAHRILEGHRLDEAMLELVPDYVDQLAAMVQLDLEAHPTFDIYPRAALLVSRPGIPGDLLRPAYGEFLQEFGPVAWRELSDLVSSYVRLASNDVDTMVALAHALVEMAFPEAVGLTYSDGEDSWELTAYVTAENDWADVRAVIEAAIAQSSGHAGMDFGDALTLTLREEPDFARIGVWASGDQVHLDLINYTSTVEGWEEYENAPGSDFTDVETSQAQQAALEIVAVASSDNDSPEGYLLRARGPAAAAAREILTLDELT